MTGICDHNLFIPNIDMMPDVRCLISFRANGRMNVKPLRVGGDGVEERDEVADSNRSRFLGFHGLQDVPRIEPYLQHRAEVLAVTSRDNLPVHPLVDAIVCTVPRLLLGFTSADCPIGILVAPGMIAGFHSGWPGTELDIATKTIQSMLALGACINDIQLFVGPHIGAGEEMCYEIQEDVASRFQNYPEWCTPKTSGTGYYLRLGGIIQEQAFKAGLSPENVTVSKECTLCDPQTFFSWRHDSRSGLPLKVMLTCIMAE